MTQAHFSPRFLGPEFFLAVSLCLGACAGNGSGNAESGQAGGARAEDNGAGGGADSDPDPGTGGIASTGGSPSAVDPGDGDVARCQDGGLEWKTGRKTNYTSWPDPGSEECIVYNGCQWAGYFAHCDGQRSEQWVAARNIAAVFPDEGVEGHDICIRAGDRVMVVTAIDTCGDSDCDGCCTNNKGDADALIDLESHTNARWGLADGAVEWADLGPNAAACAP